MNGNMSMKKGLNTFVLVFCPAFHALAGNTFIWKGGGYTTAWSDGSNWDGWVAPTAGDSVVVPAGKTATARDGDLSLLNSLAGIEIRTGGVEVFRSSRSSPWAFPSSLCA